MPKCTDEIMRFAVFVEVKSMASKEIQKTQKAVNKRRSYHPHNAPFLLSS
ncbi:Hypothetical protein BN2458_PEG1883 [Helicobacter typhlonius]|uniref:Uncharacterized protein n=1 Tax=Helicobacter typhlonius TaxID=76936 RepID=A0A0S4PZW8_9HELI|nr:Hypothetical protein BN2458_PEG1883 [Helicobacter typhlonius]